MTPEARIAAAASLLDDILAGKAAEKALTGWARRSRFAGSKDRAAVRDHVFDTLRNLRSFAARGGGMTGRGLMIGMVRAQGTDPETVFTGEGHAPAPLTAVELATGAPPTEEPERFDLPDWIWPDMVASLGEDAPEVAEALRLRAPVHIRVNMAMTTPEALTEELAQEGILALPGPLVATALEVVEGARRLSGTAAYAAGRFEFQDASSQAICEAIPLTEGLRVLDYCAGGGGKTLALGARAGLTLFAHDAAPERMKDLPVRADRAGLSVTLLDTAGAEAEGPYDLVICDVPCSGTGAWRRSPEGKWRLTAADLERLCAVQAEILDKVAPLVAPGGMLAYATCSLLDRENADQASAFLARHGGWTPGVTHRLTPVDGGDGFFLACFQRG